jgi:SAM-dependent methyltransferase
MRSQNAQGRLWGRRALDWATIQEPTGIAGYEYALAHIRLVPGAKLLDIGCGTGLFSSLAAERGAKVTALDASEALIEQAHLRTKSVQFLLGEMEELPFEDNSFDLVAGFNSFQYAEDIHHTLGEAVRVLTKGGNLIAMVWGNREDCEAASFLKAVGNFLPPQPPGTAGPFGLSENRLLEKLLEQSGLQILVQKDIPSIWDYPDSETALRGLLSVGPAVMAIESSGFDQVFDSVAEAIQPYRKENGHIVYRNTFRVAIASKG